METDWLRVFVMLVVIPLFCISFWGVVAYGVWRGIS